MNVCANRRLCGLVYINTRPTHLLTPRPIHPSAPAADSPVRADLQAAADSSVRAYNATGDPCIRAGLPADYDIYINTPDPRPFARTAQTDAAAPVARSTPTTLKQIKLYYQPLPAPDGSMDRRTSCRRCGLVNFNKQPGQTIGRIINTNYTGSSMTRHGRPQPSADSHRVINAKDIQQAS